MTAFRLLEWGRAPQLQVVAVPTPGFDEVLIEVGGVGLCHSDLLFMDAPAGRYPFPVPFTLGHEIAGVISELGPHAGQSGLAEGDAVVVGSRRPCGRCPYCQRGADNYCEFATTGLGYGLDGGLARYVVAGVRQLVALGDVDPRAAAPLPDAGRTSYHAVKKVLSRLAPDATAVVIGVGGLGGYAVQFLRLLSAARVIAVDRAPHRLDLARSVGADETVVAGDDLGSVLRELTDGRGAEVVLDFVGSDATAATALGVVRTMGAVVMAGAQGGAAQVSWTTVAREVDVCIPQGGTMADLREVVALMRSGRLVSHHEVFGFDRVAEAYRRVESGDVAGRAVVTPGQS